MVFKGFGSTFADSIELYIEEVGLALIGLLRDGFWLFVGDFILLRAMEEPICSIELMLGLKVDDNIEEPAL
jgi:hypothetical protein